MRATLLDVPGHDRRSRHVIAATVPSIAAATAEAAMARPAGERLVLLGHSTGAQAALQAALLVQDHRRLDAVVLAGPTVAPTQRRLDLLALASAAAYRRDSPRELVVLPEVLRARLRLLTLLRSAISDRPERAVPRLSVPLVLTAGRGDAFAPQWWLEVLACGATRSPAVTVERLGGSHNNPYTHADEARRAHRAQPAAARRRDTGSPAGKGCPCTSTWSTCFLCGGQTTSAGGTPVS